MKDGITLNGCGIREYYFLVITVERFKKKDQLVINMDFLEQVVAQLRKQEKLMESLGIDVLGVSAVDNEDTYIYAGHRYGFVYSEVLHGLGLFNCRELTPERADQVRKLGQTYLGLDDTLQKIVDEKGYRKITLPEINSPKLGTDAVSVLRGNVYSVLENFDTSALELIGQEHLKNKPHSGMGYALAWCSLFSALKSEQSGEAVIRELVDALQNAFVYVSANVPIQSQAFRNVFGGYREGPKRLNGAYASETNIEGFCHGTEKTIISALRL